MVLSAHQKSQDQLSPLPFNMTAAPPPSLRTERKGENRACASGNTIEAPC